MVSAAGRRARRSNRSDRHGYTRAHTRGLAAFATGPGAVRSAGLCVGVGLLRLLNGRSWVRIPAARETGCVAERPNAPTFGSVTSPALVPRLDLYGSLALEWGYFVLMVG